MFYMGSEVLQLTVDQYFVSRFFGESGSADAKTS